MPSQHVFFSFIRFAAILSIFGVCGCNNRSNTITGEERSASNMFAGQWVNGGPTKTVWWIYPKSGVIIETDDSMYGDSDGKTVAKAKLPFEIVRETTYEGDKALVLNLTDRHLLAPTKVVIRFKGEGQVFWMHSMASGEVITSFSYLTDTMRWKPEDFKLEE